MKYGQLIKMESEMVPANMKHRIAQAGVYRECWPETWADIDALQSAWFKGASRAAHICNRLGDNWQPIMVLSSYAADMKITLDRMPEQAVLLFPPR